MLAIVSITISAFAGQTGKVSQYQPEYKEGQVIVKFKQHSQVQLRRSATSTSSAVDVVLRRIGANYAEQLMPLSSSRQSRISNSATAANDLSNIYVVKFSGQSVEQAVESLKKLGEVEFAEPNYIVKAVGATPSNATQAVSSTEQHAAVSSASYSDPMFREQWGLEAINMPALWEKPIINPKRPIIAILDTGVDVNHPDLAANIWTNEGEKGNDEDGNGYAGDVHGWNFVDNNADVSDLFGHGTHCAGIAAAVGNNGIGVVGANPDALILPVKVLDNDGRGDIAATLQGIDYAIANGANIISMSYGHWLDSGVEMMALYYASASAVLVAAAGNDGVCMIESHQNIHGDPENWHAPSFPAAYESVIGVQATNQAGKLASFSNFDCDGTDISSFVFNFNYDVNVPGEYILSTVPDGGYVYMDGTSMACPMIAGAISRLLQCKEIADNETLRKTLILSDKGHVDMEKAYNITSDDIGSYNIGETFTADVNGVEMTLRITSPSTVQIGDGQHWCMDLYDASPIIIPEEIQGYKVTAIGQEAFFYCSRIPSIQIPSTVTKIGELAFAGCAELKSLFIPKTVEIIEDNICRECAKLESIVVEEGNPNYDSRNGCNAIVETKSNTLRLGCNSTIIPTNIVSIGNYAFDGSGIASVEIPQGVKYIGGNAFRKCYNLKVMNIPDGVEAIAIGAFYESGIETITIPKTVMYLNDASFGGMQKLKSLTISEEHPIYDSRDNCNAIIETATNTMLCGFVCSSIPESVTTIAPNAFYFAGITSIYIPKTVTFIGASALMGNEISSLVIDKDNPVYDSRDNCNAIIETATNTFIFGTSYSTIPASVRHIGYNAFWGSTIYDDIIIPEGIETIGEMAFYGQPFKLLVLPESVKQIGFYAFAYTSELSTVYCYAKDPIDIEFNAFCYERFLDEHAYSGTLYVPTGSKVAYEQAEGWKEFADIIEKDPENFFKFTITYMLDGEIFKTETLEYGDVIFAPQQTSEGKTIEWIDLPETMPARDIIVSGTILSNGIDTPTMTTKNTNVSIYNLSGQKVTHPINGRKGIYIVGDKKVFMK